MAGGPTLAMIQTSNDTSYQGAAAEVAKKVCSQCNTLLQWVGTQAIAMQNCTIDLRAKQQGLAEDPTRLCTDKLHASSHHAVRAMPCIKGTLLQQSMQTLIAMQALGGHNLCLKNYNNTHALASHTGWQVAGSHKSALWVSLICSGRICCHVEASRVVRNNLYTRI